MAFDYTTVGHVTVDVMADGSRRPGGSAFYAALQAARLGRRTLIITRGVAREIEELLAPFRAEFELRVLEAPQTTALGTLGSGERRSQAMLGWAGEIGAEIEVDTEILHLAPIARETPNRWRGRAAFVGATPQGLVRRWSGIGAPITPAELDRSLLPAHCDAIVISEGERPCCAQLVHEARADPAGPARGALLAVTAGAAPTELLLPGGRRLEVAVAPLAELRDDTGAGDVFAAALFLALSEGGGPRSAALYATAAAAVRIAGEGARAIGDAGAIADRLAARRS